MTTITDGTEEGAWLDRVERRAQAMLVGVMSTWNKDRDGVATANVTTEIYGELFVKACMFEATAILAVRHRSEGGDIE